MAQVSDLKLSALRIEAATTIGQTDQLENAWLKSTGAGALGNQTEDLWRDFIANISTLNVPLQHINDMYYKWLGLQGFTGALDDRWFEFWNDYGTLPDDGFDFRKRPASVSPFTFTRPSKETDTNENGIITQKPNNEPAYFRSSGIICQPQRTNLAPYSNDFLDASWTALGLIKTPAASVSPDGTVNATKMIATNVTSDHAMGLPNIVPVGVPTIFSIYLKAGENTKARLALYTTSCDFDLILKTVTGANGFIQDVGNGWLRCSVFNAAPAAATQGVVYLLNAAGQSTYTGNNIDGFYIFGGQLEQGSYITGYIPTSGSSAARAAIALTRLTSSLTGFTGDDFAFEFLFYPDHNYNQVADSALTKVFSCRASGTSRIELEANGTNDVFQFARIHAGGNIILASAAGALNYVRGTPIKILVKQTIANGMTMIVNDVVYTEASAGAKSAWVDPLPTNFAVGCRDIGTNQLGGTMATFKMWVNDLPLLLKNL